MSPFLAEGRHDTLKKAGIECKGRANRSGSVQHPHQPSLRGLGELELWLCIRQALSGEGLHQQSARKPNLSIEGFYNLNKLSKLGIKQSDFPKITKHVFHHCSLCPVSALIKDRRYGANYKPNLPPRLVLVRGEAWFTLSP